MLKKTILTVFGVISLLINEQSIADAAYSVTTSTTLSCDRASHLVTQPCETNQWELGIQALYLKPLYSPSLGYVSTEGLITQQVNPKWGFGYRLEGAYVFNTGNDLSINWSHYNINSHLGTFSGQYFQVPIGPIAANYQLILDNRYDQVNLVLGQAVNFGLLKSAHFYGGLQYANLRVDSTNNYNISPLFLIGTGGSVQNITNTDFNGFGPTIGIDYAYDLSQKFSITANTVASLLYGTSRYNFATAYGNGLVAAFAYTSKKIIVPGIEAKLGANYVYEIAHGVLNLEGGYQVINYFHALPTRSLILGTITASNFGLYGPYFGVKWLGNA